MSLSPTLELAMDLIRRQSVTPDDAGCQALMMSRLAPLGFAGEDLRFGDTDNLWARKGSEGPLLAFAGHTDVVPTGPEKNWAHPPFEQIGRASCRERARMSVYEARVNNKI